MRSDLLERLRKVDCSYCRLVDPDGTVTNWHRNPDGPEAADEIEQLQKRARDMHTTLVTIANVGSGEAQRQALMRLRELEDL
jgi:hypothetical protein